MKRLGRLVWLALGMVWGAAASSGLGQAVLVFGAVNPNAPAGGQAGGCLSTHCSTCGQPLNSAPPPVRYRTPDVIYVGAARGYPQPNYFSGWAYGPAWSSYWAPNVIPFGLGQAYVHGYWFRHCR